MESLFYLKNNGKSVKVFHVKTPPAGVEVFPMKVRILPDENKPFKLFVFSEKEEDQSFDVTGLLRSTCSPGVAS